MTQGLKRYQFSGDLHFVTFSCYQRRQYLGSVQACALFEEALERTRSRYALCVIGYVIMPEHVHLLLSEPAIDPLSRALHALKLSVSKLSRERPSGRPGITISMFSPHVSRSRSFVTCTGIRLPADLLLARKIGLTRASITMRRDIEVW